MNVNVMVATADKVKDHSKAVVFLMCREKTEGNSDTGEKAKAFALFDSDSQSSSITEKLADRPKTSEKLHKNLLIGSLGAKKPVQYNTGVVQVGIRMQTDGVRQMKLEVLEHCEADEKN